MLKKLAGTTGLEPATSCVTGMRSNQLNYVPGENCCERQAVTSLAPNLDFTLTTAIVVGGIRLERMTFCL